MVQWIERTTNGRRVIALFGLALAVYVAMTAVTIPRVRAGTGGLEVFDLRPLGYSEGDARAFLANLSETANAYYRHVQIPLDFLYPLLLALFGAFALAWVRRRLAIPRWLIGVPFAAGVFDYLENIGILMMLGGNTGRATIAAANVCTICKSMLTAVLQTGLVVMLVIVGITAARQGWARKHEATGSRSAGAQEGESEARDHGSSPVSAGTP